MTGAPLVVVTQDVDLLNAAASIERMGYTVAHGFALPRSPWNLSATKRVCTATVSDVSDARDAVIAAARGCALAIASDPKKEVHGRLIADLERIGSVRLTVEAARQLSSDQREILSLLAEGESIPKAADRLFLSLRTAERRVAGARRALGVRTTAEAVVRYLTTDAP